MNPLKSRRIACQWVGAFVLGSYGGDATDPPFLACCGLHSLPIGKSVNGFPFGEGGFHACDTTGRFVRLSRTLCRVIFKGARGTLGDGQ